LSSIVDWRILCTHIEDTNTIQHISNVFLEDNRRRLQKIKQALEQQDGDQVRSLAHALNGSATAIACTNLSAASKQLETCAQTEAPETIQSYFQDILYEFQRLETLFQDPDWMERLEEECLSESPA